MKVKGQSFKGKDDHSTTPTSSYMLAARMLKDV